MYKVEKNDAEAAGASVEAAHEINFYVVSKGKEDRKIYF